MSRQDDIEQLISSHNRRLQVLKNQKALHGIDTPPRILLEIEDIEEKLNELKVELELISVLPGEPISSNQQGQSPGNITPPVVRVTQNRSRLSKIGLASIFKRILVSFGIVVVILIGLIVGYLAFVGVPDCTTSLGINPAPSSSVSDDEFQIRYLIKVEAESVLDQNVAAVMGIFREDSIVKSASGQEWSGCEEIKDRYKRVIESYIFTSLSHEVTELKIRGNTATAKSIVETEYMLRNPLDEYMAEVSGLSKSLPIDKSGEIWRFKKVNGIWKVTQFIYGLQPDENIAYHHIFAQ